MSFKLQLFPLSGTGEIHWHLPIENTWEYLSADTRNVEFLKPWLACPPDIVSSVAPRQADNNKLLGLALSVFVSAGIWMGIGLMIEHLWK